MSSDWAPDPICTQIWAPGPITPTNNNNNNCEDKQAEQDYWALGYARGHVRA